MINTGVVTNVIGVLLVLLGGFMFTSLFFAAYYQSGDNLSILYAALTTMGSGGLLWFLSRKAAKRIGKREGFLIVALGWCSVAVFSALPYLYSGVLSDPTNAIFESVSGLTTTGATVINDIESVPQGVLFWRSLTQWIGGMGIIVLTVAIFPLLGIGGVELFVAEAPGPTSDKIHPRIKETAKRLWFIYLGLTSTLILLLFLNGMTLFDAFNHGLTTMATGGFSTKNASIAHFDTPAIQYILTLFMLVAGINYTIIYYGLKGKFRRVWKSDEFKAYLSVILGLVLLVTFVIYGLGGSPLERSFRYASFQVISVLTTTGFVTADYTAWAPSMTLLFFVLFFVGACAGSTSGGIKIIRHLVLLKNSLLELKRLLHPKALIRMKIDNKIVAPRVLTHILVFLLFYLIVFVIGSIIMTWVFKDFENPFLTSIGAVATSLGNVGPAIGELGPLDNFAKVPSAGKWLLTLFMLLGRLELFTILVLFTPYFWRRN